jgi:arylsulfatase A-like enzyme/Tfp pilus assembly protein PilF
VALGVARRAGGFVVRATFAAALALAACRAEPALRFPGAPIVLVSIDTLRADHLPLYGYDGVATPGIDRLAADGIVFDNAYSHYPLTLPSHVTLLTGLLPPAHGVRDNSGYRFAAASHPFMPRLLRTAGYATGGFVSALVLRGETGLAADFDAFDSEIPHEPGASLDAGQRPGLETAALALDWVRARGAQPFFLFLHLYEPHAPYQPPEPFASRYAESPYDGEIATADIVIGGLLDELDRLGIYERAIVVLVADHGEGLGDYGENYHGIFLYRATVHVPLVVKLPGRARAGSRVTRPVGLVDVAPTLVELAGVAANAPFDGSSLLAPRKAGGPATGIYAETYVPRLHFGWSDLQAIYEERWAYVDAPEPELFDLAADPGQERSVLAQHRREAARLRAVVERFDRPLAAREGVDAETAAQLAALGYLTGPSVARDTDLPDPKSNRELLGAIESAFKAFADARHEQAVVELRAVLAAHDGLLDAWTRLGRSLHALGREEEAVAAWEKALELSGGAAELALLVAGGKVNLQRFDEARSLAELGRAHDPRAADEILVQVDLATGRRDDALRRMEQLVREGRASEPTLRRLAALRRQRGAPAEALALLAPLLPGAEPPTRAVYALALSDLGRDEEAFAQLAPLAAAEPENPALLAALGTVLLKLGRAGEAREALERAVRFDPGRADSWNTLGVARYRTAGARSAMAAWQRALALDPARYDVLFNLGLVALEAGERGVARRSLERFVAEAPRESFGADIAKARAALTRLAG